MAHTEQQLQDFMGRPAGCSQNVRKCTLAGCYSLIKIQFINKL